MPTLSVAVALIVTWWLRETVAPDLGEVMKTIGGVLSETTIVGVGVGDVAPEFKMMLAVKAERLTVTLPF